MIKKIETKVEQEWASHTCIGRAPAVTMASVRALEKVPIPRPDLSSLPANKI